MATELQINRIRTDGGTQARATIDQQVVHTYSELYQQPLSPLPPIEVVHDGKNYWLWDGYHRLRGCKMAGHETIQANVQQGTQRDAILLSAGANASHGLPRSLDDRRRAVQMLLNDDEWRCKSSRWIAETARVNPHLVESMRQACEAPQPTARVGRDGVSRKVQKDAEETREDEEDDGILECDSGEQDAEPPTSSIPHPKTNASLLTAKDHFRSFSSKLKTAIDGLNDIVDKPGYEALLRSSGQAMLTKLISVQDTFAQCEPVSDCVYCGGPGCDKCGNAGWLPKAVIKRLKDV